MASQPWVGQKEQWLLPQVRAPPARAVLRYPIPPQPAAAGAQGGAAQLLLSHITNDLEAAWHWAP